MLYLLNFFCLVSCFSHTRITLFPGCCFHKDNSFSFDFSFSSHTFPVSCFTPVLSDANYLRHFRAIGVITLRSLHTAVNDLPSPLSVHKSVCISSSKVGALNLWQVFILRTCKQSLSGPFTTCMLEFIWLS